MGPLGKRKRRQTAAAAASARGKEDVELPAPEFESKLKESTKSKAKNENKNFNKSENDDRVLKEIQETPSTTPETNTSKKARSKKGTTTVSTPPMRRRKAPDSELKNLVSDLSPKYIGFTSPNSSGNNTSRYGRLQKFNEKEGYLPSEVIGAVRRTSPFKSPPSANKNKSSKSIPKELKAHVVIDRMDLNVKVESFDNYAAADKMEDPASEANELDIIDESEMAAEIYEHSEIEDDVSEAPIKDEAETPYEGELIAVEIETIQPGDEDLFADDCAAEEENVEIETVQPVEEDMIADDCAVEEEILKANTDQLSEKEMIVDVNTTQENENYSEYEQSEKLDENRNQTPEEEERPPTNQEMSHDYFNNISVQQSPDSAQGSSIDTCDVASDQFVAGELYWAQMFKFPYWPCIIWPDTEGKTIDVIGAQNTRPIVKVHVRFFGNNGRHAWVRKTHFLPYEGKDAFMAMSETVKNNTNKNSALYKHFTIIARLKDSWTLAVKEAEETFVHPLDQRDSKFEELLKETQKVQQVKRLEKRRLSMVSNRNMFNQHEHLAKRMKRSPTPESPAFEDIDDFPTMPKKRKLESAGSSVDLTASKDNDELDDFKRAVNAFVLGKNEAFNQETEVLLQGLWNIRQKSISTNGTKPSVYGSRRLASRLQSTSMQSNRRTPTPQTSKLVEKPKDKKPAESRTRPIDEVIDDIFNLDDKYLFRGMSKENVCVICHEGGVLSLCARNCQTWLHRECGANFPKKPKKENQKKGIAHVTGDSEDIEVKDEPDASVEVEEIVCKYCQPHTAQVCFVCKDAGTSLPIRCDHGGCGKFIHEECLREFPQHNFKNKNSDGESLMCPAHVCHTCAWRSDRRIYTPMDKTKATKCILCPTAYHMDSRCIPAGTEILSQTQVICPRHIQNKSSQSALNINWCIICASDANNERLICCESCPHSVHASCSNDEVPDGKYICDTCKHGRFPMYGEMVWAKFNNFRWWPSIIIPPPEIPLNIIRLKHKSSDFVIRFFGTNDHGWISRNRVYSYQTEDTENYHKHSKNGLDKQFQLGVSEANRVHGIIQQKESQMVVKAHNVAPEPYTKLKVNRFVPPVTRGDLFCEDKRAEKCKCDESNPCGIESGCVNRVMYTECEEDCPLGEKCENKQFEQRKYAKYKVKYFNEKGFGLVAVEPIPAGTFIIEYVGEIINMNEHKKRMAQQIKDKSENFYFCGLDSGYMIDAGPKGNDARFMNHSCEPNCETEKWAVNGMTRLGIFAKMNIPVNTELTFNYYLEAVGDKKMACHCGARRCSKFIGAKYMSPKKIEEKKKEAKPTKKNNKKKAKQVAKKLILKPESFPKKRVLAAGKRSKAYALSEDDISASPTSSKDESTDSPQADKSKADEFRDHNMNTATSLTHTEPANSDV